MDEWDNVRQRIRELQGSIVNSSYDVRSTLDQISVADFWKRRYEEEKQLWEERLAKKEREQSTIQEKFNQDEQGVRELSFKLRELEGRLQSEKMLWEERSKVKSLESEIEKKKIEWDAKTRSIEDENQQLRAKLRQGTELSEEEVRRRQHAESEKMRFQDEVKELQRKLQDAAADEQKKIRQIELEREALQKQLQDLQSVKEQGKEKSVEIEKELALLSSERDIQLSVLAEREKEQFESFEDLARGFAHKVRNYLGIMSGTLQLCMTNYKMDDELKKHLALVEQNAQDMLKSIEEFLSLSKIPELSFQSASINELLSNVLYTLEDAARPQKVRFDKNFTEPLPPVYVDTKLLSEAFKQIALNAIEASPVGGAVTISTNYESHSGKLSVRIADGGKGISENHLKKVFQPYFTTKKGKKGLGLCAAKRAIDLHHGSLSIASSKDQGTTLTVQIAAQRTSVK